MRRADRLFRLVQLLRARRVATGAWLAQELEVSLRTVYRDIADLVAADVPIRGEAGVGYSLARGFELPPLTFTTEELEALALGLRFVQSWADPELAAAARSAHGRLEAALPATMREVLAAVPLFSPDDGQSGGDRLGAMRRAIADHRKVRVAYQRADGQRSERTLIPLGLYFWGRTWSLAAWCELRQDYRNFRPDRMLAVEVLDETFDPADGIDLATFLERQAEQERDVHLRGVGPGG